MILSYLNCDSSKYPFFFAFCAFIVFIRGLSALICLAGAVEAGGSLESGNPRIKEIEEEESRRRLLIANVIIIPPQLSPSRPGITPKDISGINLTLLSSLDIAGLVFLLLEACSAFLIFSLTAKARSANFNLINFLTSARSYIFVYIIYFRFKIRLELLIKSSCITK